MKNLLRSTLCLVFLSAALNASAHAASTPAAEALAVPGFLAAVGAAVAAAFTAPAHAAAVNAVPEIDSSVGPAALALLGGAMMIFRGRRRA